MSDWISSPAAALRGDLEMPGDKSISHRAVMLAALAEGTSHINGFLESEDTCATVRAFVQMGVHIEAPAPGERVVHGVGLRGLRAPQAPIDCGNAGTGMRLLTGLLAGQGFDSTLTGDASLSRRPMLRVIDPLTRMGANIEATAAGLPPLHIHGKRALLGIDYALPMASAQVKSAILLAGLYAGGETRVTEPRPTRDYTERLLAMFGWPLQFGTDWTSLRGGQHLQATDIAIPADFSSVAFFLVAASLLPGSELRLRDVGMNPRRIGLLHVLRAMGADIVEEDPREYAGEPVANLVIRHAPLRGVEVPLATVPDMIDEFPILFVAAAVAQGTTTVRGARELRVKETDRIAVMCAGLRALGARIEETDDGMDIEGSILHGGVVDACGDHRCAMAFAVAGAIARAPVHIRDCANVATSFPGFEVMATRAGLRIEAKA